MKNYPNQSYFILRLYSKQKPILLIEINQTFYLLYNMMDFSGFKKLAILSAPGKVILCGQHAVVYGEDALAMAINLRCRSTIFSKQCNKEQEPKIIFKGSINHTLNINLFPQNISDEFNQFLVSQQHEKSYNQQFYKIVFKISVFKKQTGLKFDTSKIYCIDISSDIPIGKCLGSSAAFNTVLVGSLFTIMLKQNCNEQKSNLNLDQINRLSKILQKVEHGNPSGIDNYVATIGGLVLYNKQKNPPFQSVKDPLILQKLTNSISLRLIDSGIEKNTKKAVGIVRQHVQKDEKYKLMIKKIGTYAQTILSMLSQTDHSQNGNLGQNWKPRLYQIMTQNHLLLKQLGVSINEIEQIVNKNTIKGQKGSKITGAGMGGFVLVAENFINIENAVSKNQIITKIDQNGLMIQKF